MDSRQVARLERLRLLIEPDLAALPDRALSPDPEPSNIERAPAEGGGVSLCTEDAPSFALLGQKSGNCTTEEVPSSASDAASAAKMDTMEARPEPPPSKNEQSDSKKNTERRFVWIHGAESSYNLGSKPQLSALPAHSLPPAVLQMSELAAPHEKHFAPIIALSKYPYKFCNKSCMQDIASAFFDQGKFWAREWDLYYLWGIEESKPLILVRESQVEDLLKEINSQLKLDLRITDSQRDEGFVLRFPDHPRCRPRYLGRSHTRDEYNNMTDQVPAAVVRLPNELAPPSLDHQTLEDFKLLIEEAWEVQKNKSKASKEKKRVDRMQKQKVFTDQLKRAQRYLGLRPTAPQGKPATGAPPAVDVSLSVPFPYDRSVVFVSVDVEAYERDRRKITEVGVATLDTRDLLDVAPGKDGENWRSKIRARHFRIAEYTHLINSEFVSGCPDNFYYGKSEKISMKDAPAAVSACFAPPFCAEPSQPSWAKDNSRDEKRNIIFLGHDALTDVKHLQDLGFDPLTLPNLLEYQDSANIYRVWRRDQQITNLRKILFDFDIPGWGAHNAGNDAVYTVWAFLSVCVREAAIRNSVTMEEFRTAVTESKIASAQEVMKHDIEAYATEWDTLDAEGDGGEPVPIEIKKPSPPAAKETASDTSSQTGTSDTSASGNVGGHGSGRGRIQKNWSTCSTWPRKLKQ